MGNYICDRFHNDDALCSVKLRGNMCTVDNIGHNPSSTTAKGSLHGTAFSIYQRPEADNIGMDREGIFINENLKRDNIKSLPERCSMIPPVILPKEPAAVPLFEGPLMIHSDYFSDA
ncbi:hypothetical protein DPMN_146258 [Dreissena polymorpha]|uniref:Uncharacterized protein n=1 Tax=Dreissena polymorpha TaxID=45954 RepID=A0A9D4F5I4_DREPO|nr:hypothetical protein DPMN_146258 [Dreissena polymorpha]